MNEKEWTSGTAIYTPAFVKNYSEEISAMISNINNPQNNKLMHQSLPKHMRRRAMSHNPKRIPRQYRRMHQFQMSKGGDPLKTKRPARRYRRRPNNLLKEYVRRKMKNIWLETHIWHAKRFHMTERYGYKLPLSACDKSYRASYRASSRYCLLQDISYLGCIEVTGPYEVLKTGFQRMTSAKCGLTITAKVYSSGCREGRVDMFKMDAYPEQAIGNVSFFWRQQLKETDSRSLWIYAHPTFYKELIEELIVVFDLSNEFHSKESTKMDHDGVKTESISRSKKKRQQMRLITRNDTSIRCPTYSNTTTKVAIVELKDTMNRFRLTGPLSQTILSNSFKCTTNKASWFASWVANGKNEVVHVLQSEFWDAVKTVVSPAELSPNMILALNVDDPRIHRPKLRSKALPKMDEELCFNPAVMEISRNSAISALWSPQVRRKLIETMLTTHEYNQLREKHVLVPGESADFEKSIQPVPVLLIQRPGNQTEDRTKRGYGCGWDVIIPSGYGLIVWHNLVLWGAKAGGLREIETLNRESGHDDHLPDTIFAKKDNDRKFLAKRAKFFQLPTNKRENFNKLGIATPFKCDWQRLTSDWSGNENSPFFVVRDQEKLVIVKEALNRKFNIGMAQLTGNCLIPVLVMMIARGTITENSIICMPTKDDLRLYARKLKSADNSPFFIEPNHKDPNEVIRKQMRRTHQRLLKRLRNRRVRRKRRQQEKTEKPVRIEKAGTEALVRAEFEKMCDLWLPAKPATVRRQCSREVFGYVTKGDFCFGQGKCTGIGYVVGGALEKLLKVCSKGKVHVLVRSTDSQVYRFASISVRTGGI